MAFRCRIAEHFWHDAFAKPVRFFFNDPPRCRDRRRHLVFGDPYVCDQFAMARLKRASFALLLALLPATASAIGILVLRQIPSLAEAAGIVLVIAAVALHRAEAAPTH